jgi:Lrp/AsnC family leucine-responsive transcriptional regulator
VKLDEIDLRILYVLQDNARVPILELSERVGLSPTPCSRRLRRLEEGIIKKYIAVLEPEVTGLGIRAFVNVRVRHSQELRDEFNATIMQLPNIRQCYAVTGGSDYVLSVNARDMRDFSRWVLQDLHSVPSVLYTHTSIVLESIKDEPYILLRDFSALADQKRGEK